MAVKKTETAADTTIEDLNAAVEMEAPAPAAPVVEEVTTVQTAEADDTGFCVYLGPTIHGVIQSGMVLQGNRTSAEEEIADAIAKYPLIAKLIVTNKTIAKDRIKVKTAGNALNVYYKKLASGKTI